MSSRSASSRSARQGGRPTLERVLLYGLPGLLAAVSALAALASLGHPGLPSIVLTGTLVVLGFGVPPVVDWLGVRRRRRSALDPVRLRAEAELGDHFRLHGRGLGPAVMRSGFYFTGRTQVLQELADWLAGPATGAERTRVITGAPGSGKSAVLGRLVDLTAAHPGGGAGAVEGPPLSYEGPVVAVHARGRTAGEVAQELAAGLGIDAPGVGGLLSALREPGRNLDALAVVDAVDEAADPFQLAVELLEPLGAAARPGLRLVVGTRRGGEDSLIGLFGPAARVVDLDEPRYRDPGDTELYVLRLLLATQEPQFVTPYRDRPDLAAAVARAVAARAGMSFLIAQLTALSLAAAPAAVDTGEAGWAARFPATVGAAMERYLRDARPGGAWLRDLLLPLAWAEGDGLDDPQTWAAMATALGTDTYTEHDVARLMLDTPAVNLLRRTPRGDRTAVRLFHEALGEHLRTHDGGYRSARETQRRLTEVLVGRVPVDGGGRPAWGRADVYTQTYLPVHAARGGSLDALVAQAGFLAMAEPGRLLAALPAVAGARGRAIADTVERVGQQLLTATDDERVCYLEMAAHMAGDRDLAADLAAFAPQRPWSVVWARWDALDPSRLLGHYDDYVLAVRIVGRPRGPLVLAASAHTVRAWWLADGEPLNTGIHDARPPIEDMVAYVDGDDVMLLTLHEDGELRRTPLGDATRGTTLVRDRTISGQRQLWLLRRGDQHVAVTRRGAQVELVSAVDGRVVGPPLDLAETDAILDAKTLDGRDYLATSSRTGEVTLWDLADGSPVGSPLRFGDHLIRWTEITRMWDGAIGRLDGDPVVLTGTNDFGVTAVWNPLRGEIVGEPYDGVGPMSALAVNRDRGDLWCWGSAQGDVLIRQPGIGRVRQLAGHDNGVQALAAWDLDGATMLVSGGRDGAVRVWRLKDGAGRAPSTRRRRSAVGIPAAGGAPVLLATLESEELCLVLDAATGTPLERIAAPAGEPFRFVRTLPGPAPRLVMVDTANQVHIYDALQSEPLATYRIDADVPPVDLAPVAGSTPVLLVALGDGRLLFLDPSSGAQTRPPLVCHEGDFRVFADQEPVEGTLQFVTRAAEYQTVTRLWTVIGDDASWCPLGALPDPRDNDYVGEAAFGRISELRVVATGGGSYLHTWSAKDGTESAGLRLRQGHGMAVGAVGLGEVAGRPLVLAGGYTCTLAMWEPGSADEHHLLIGTPLWSAECLPGDRVAVGATRGVMVLQFGPQFPGGRLPRTGD